MLWSDFILFILVDCVMDFFLVSYYQDFYVTIIFVCHGPPQFIFCIEYYLYSYFILSHFSCKYHCNRIAMGNKKDTQKVKDTKTNFKWSQPMQNLLLEILANEALHGNKQSNTFKHASYAKVAEAITEKFMTECTPKHVEHRFKTVKPSWNTIALLRNKKSRFGWNDDLKMITCDRTVYDEEVKERNFYYFYFIGRNFLVCIIVKFKFFSLFLLLSY